MNKILVVIPAYNEEKTIYDVVTKSLNYADVSVTDDGSRDRTTEILKSIISECAKGKHANKLNIITHTVTSHIPHALQDGLKYAMIFQYDFIVTMDAGLSHDPDMLPSFFNYDHNTDVVIGSRRKKHNVPLYRKVISVAASKIVNYSLTASYFDFRGPGIEDCTSGYRRYSKKACELIARARLQSKSFDFHMEALSICYQAGMKIKEIPIHYAFSNSSFKIKDLKQAIKLGAYLISTKKS